MPALSSQVQESFLLGRAGGSENACFAPLRQVGVCRDHGKHPYGHQCPCCPINSRPFSCRRRMELRDQTRRLAKRDSDERVAFALPQVQNPVIRTSELTLLPPFCGSLAYRQCRLMSTRA
jgi:hypothetical protein